MYLMLLGSGRMGTGLFRRIGFTGSWPAFEANGYRGSACTCNSDTIGVDFCMPPVSQGEGQRKAQNAGSIGATIPCPRTPFSTQSFSFWNQPVAATSENCLRQLEIRSACPEEFGSKIATLNRAFYLNSALP